MNSGEDCLAEACHSIMAGRPELARTIKARFAEMYAAVFRAGAASASGAVALPETLELASGDVHQNFEDRLSCLPRVRSPNSQLAVLKF